MKVDSLDLQIIRILQKDGRRTFAEIGRELNVPAGVVQGRFAKMKHKGLIVNSALIINPSKIGILHSASVVIEARESEVEEVKRYVEGLKVGNALIEAWTVFGRYNISVAVWLRNIEEIFKIKEMIKVHPAVVNVDVSLTKNFQFIAKIENEKILERSEIWIK